VKASGELVCFGNNYYGQCEVREGLGVLAATSSQALRCFTPQTSNHVRESAARAQEVVQHIEHWEAAAEIPEDEAAAIVAEQEASLVQHNLDSVGWHAEVQTEDHVGAFLRVVLLQFSRSTAEMERSLEQSVHLQPARDALLREGYGWRLPSGAKVFMDPHHFHAVRSHLSRQWQPCHVIVTEDLEPFVMEAVRQLPSRLQVRLRGATPLGLVAEEAEGIVLVDRTFLHVPTTGLRNPESVAQSTTEARTRNGYHGVNPRRRLFQGIMED